MIGVAKERGGEGSFTSPCKAMGRVTWQTVSKEAALGASAAPEWSQSTV